MIPGREINFSAMERNSVEFQQTMYWARLIVNVGIFSLLIHESYVLFLATFGVGIGIYGMKQEEKETLRKQQERENETTRRQVFNANQDRLREYERMARRRGWKK